MASLLLGLSAVVPAIANAAGAPSATTDAADTGWSYGATLHGKVISSGNGTTVHFAYVANANYLPGTSDPYGAGDTTADQTVSAAAGADQSVRTPITGLQPNTVYHYRLVATNSTGPVQGGGQTFQTSGSGSPSQAVSFAPAVNYPVASVPGSIAHGDFNSDGKQDLVTASSSGVVSVLLGNGDGTFEAPLTTSLPTGDCPGTLAVGDLNGDGKLDVVVQNRCGVSVSSVSVLLGKGDGTFAAPVDYAPAKFGGAIATLSSVALVDVSGDGRPDILLTESDTPPIFGVGAEVMINNGDGTFRTPVQYPAGNTYNAGRSVTAADVTGDGLPDLILANNNCCFNYSYVSVFGGTGGGAFALSPTNYPVQTGAASVRAGDLNGDGKPDLAVFSSGNPFYDGTQPAVSVLLNNGDGTFQPPVVYRTETPGASAIPGSGPQYLTLVDVNGDGSLDAITTTNDNGAAPVVAIVVNNGNGTFQPHQDFATDGGPAAVTAADFNGDGKSDLATANQGGSDVSVLLNTTPFPSPLGALTASGIDFSAAQGRLVTPTVASFSDSDLSASISSYTAMIDWGDATPRDAAEVDSPNSVCQPCTVSYGHTYARPGTFTVTITISKAGGGSPSGGGQVVVISYAHVADPFAFCTGSGAGINPFVQGIELTQGVQTDSFPDTSEGCGPAPGFPGIHPAAQYPHGNPFNQDGTVRYVLLVAGRKTVVRVYAAASGAQAGPAPPIVARLYALRGGRLIPSRSDAPNPQAPDNGPLSVPRGSGPPSWSERADPTGAFQFTIPEAWAHRDLTLVAQINPPGATPSMGECASCQVDDLFTLSGIHFIPTRPVFIRSPALIAQGESLPPPEDVFMGLRSVLPVADSGLRTPVGSYDGVLIGNASQVCDSPGIVDKLLLQWGALQSFGTGFSVNRVEGIYSGYRRHPNGADAGVDCQGGATQPSVGAGPGYTGTPLPGSSYSVAAASRPLTSVTHEIFHGLGLPHAGSNCYGRGGMQQGAFWPPDDQGFLQGIGTDVLSFSPLTSAYDIKAPPAPNAGYGQQLFDLMSYCIWDRTPGLNPNDGSDAMYLKGLAAIHTWEQITWSSPRSWDALVDRLSLPGAGSASASSTQSPQVGATASAAGSGVLNVLVASGAGSPTITVFPGPTLLAAATVPSSYTLQTIARDGHVSASVPMSVGDVHQDFAPDETVLEAQVPSIAVAELEVLANGRVVARRRRPPRPERPRILAPVRRTVARCDHRGCVLLVRWRPNAPADAGLQAAIDVSGDGGRSWRTIFLGPDVGSASVSERLLGYSRHERVRVRVNDGFDQAIALSAPFVSAGSPPTVAILSPVPRQQIAEDGSLYLSGQASDDADRAIVGHRLHWYLGRRLLGVGSGVSAEGLPAGARRITLVARDIRGRTGRATVTLRVLAERPQFLVLHLPRRLSPRARRLVLRVSSLAPATLTVSGRGVRRVHVVVSRRLATITVRITRGRGPLQLRIDLANGQFHTLTRVLVRR